MTKEDYLELKKKLDELISELAERSSETLSFRDSGILYIVLESLVQANVSLSRFFWK